MIDSCWPHGVIIHRIHADAVWVIQGVSAEPDVTTLELKPEHEFIVLARYACHASLTLYLMELTIDLFRTPAAVTVCGIKCRVKRL